MTLIWAQNNCAPCCSLSSGPERIVSCATSLIRAPLGANSGNNSPNHTFPCTVTGPFCTGQPTSLICIFPIPNGISTSISPQISKVLFGKPRVGWSGTNKSSSHRPDSIGPSNAWPLASNGISTPKRSALNFMSSILPFALGDVQSSHA